MKIRIRGAYEHNLKNVDAWFPEGLSAVTGISGSGKSSLVYDVLYHEARRKTFEAFSARSSSGIPPGANVKEITGLGPAVALGQDLLNRNPRSTLASASGIHPYLRILYARFGERQCSGCGTKLRIESEEEIVSSIAGLRARGIVQIGAALVMKQKGSHRTLLRFLKTEFPENEISVDGSPWKGEALDPGKPHDIVITTARFVRSMQDETGVSDSIVTTDSIFSIEEIRNAVKQVFSLGAEAVKIENADGITQRSPFRHCPECGKNSPPIEPGHFHAACPACGGRGCGICGESGLHPLSREVSIEGLGFSNFLEKTVDDALTFIKMLCLSSTANRVTGEIRLRLEALSKTGLGYLGLDRPVPTLSRGEAQRLKLSAVIASPLTDMIHILDEPTIGLHPSDTEKLIDCLRELPGPVIFVEHDRAAIAGADRVIDLGPGAGNFGGNIVFEGSPLELLSSGTESGKRFAALLSGKPAESAENGLSREKTPSRLLSIRGACARNLKHIDADIPLSALTVITGVSGSGKSTLVEEVLVPSLESGKAVFCDSFFISAGKAESGDNDRISDENGFPETMTKLPKAVFVTQDPIGVNPRSNPATYTKLADTIRDLFSQATGLPASLFTFNGKDGACPECGGTGAIETRMRYAPASWLHCGSCGGRRFSDEVLENGRVLIAGELFSIADFLELPASEAEEILTRDLDTAPAGRKRLVKKALTILSALLDTGLGYLTLGQPSPELSGGEAQRVKLAKYLGKAKLENSVLILDEPSTGLHPADVDKLLSIFRKLVKKGATIIVVEHDTDIIRNADTVIDLGPGAGPSGGEMLYQGRPSGLIACGRSRTGTALKNESSGRPSDGSRAHERRSPGTIEIRGARANNLQDVNLSIKKGSFTVLSGVSGSGKSSLLHEVLEKTAKKRFYESLSVYERQNARFPGDAETASIEGLGMTASVQSERMYFDPRSTIGSMTGISVHLALLFALYGERRCTNCCSSMKRFNRKDVCEICGNEKPAPDSRHFSPDSYSAACTVCQGIGTLQRPNPDKLIVHPEKPLFKGAMYSPGFFPQGYLAKPFNGGYDMVTAFARRNGFDPATTPWNEMSESARNAFLYGETEPFPVLFRNRAGRTQERTVLFPGFYGWIRDWDTGGTYTDTVPCPGCKGERLRKEYLEVRLNGKNIRRLERSTLCELYDFLNELMPPASALRSPGTVHTDPSPSLTGAENAVPAAFTENRNNALSKLAFLKRVGLGYLSPERRTFSLSAGEAGRVRLAGLLGSGLSSLCILLDEPSRGLHPRETEALADCLKELAGNGNTVIAIEHDLSIVARAETVVELGPGSGKNGGRILAAGSPEEIAQTATPTGRHLLRENAFPLPAKRRKAKGRLILKGARENNLKGIEAHFPLGVLLGVCGVSGSGKSTLVHDTLGRISNRQATRPRFRESRLCREGTTDCSPNRKTPFPPARSSSTSLVQERPVLLTFWGSERL